MSEEKSQKPLAPARPSSTILLVRDGADGMEVFMVVRHHEIDFASGALVFPGGSLEPDDHELAQNAAACGPGAGSDPLLRAMRVGAIRETFEECGVLLARRRGSPDFVDEAARADFSGRVAAGAGFGAAVEACGLELALDGLAPFAHWVTPRFMAKRFDTHFFVAAAPADQRPLHDGREAVDSCWIGPGRALEAAERGEYTIIFPTRLNLGVLARQNRVADALAAARARTIVTVEPAPTEIDGRKALRIPLEAGYGGDVFPVDAPGVLPVIRSAAS